VADASTPTPRVEEESPRIEALLESTQHHFRPVSEDGPPRSEWSPGHDHRRRTGGTAGVRAAERGVGHDLFERSVIADTVVKYQKGKLVMAEPPQLLLQPELKMSFEEAVREQMLEWWNGAIRKSGARALLVSPDARRERSFGSIPASTSMRPTRGRAEA